MSRTTRGRAATAATLAVVFALGGCTISSASPDGEETSAGEAATRSAASPDQGSGDAEPSRTTASRRDVTALSREVLAQAEADTAAATIIGSASADERGDTITLDVMSLRRTSDAVLLEFRLSSPTPDLDIGVTNFAAVRFNSVNFIKVVFLDDTAGGTRYLPLFFDDGRQGCVCPYLPLTLGPEPQTLFAMFPPLPEAVTTVDVALSESLVVPGVPVG